MTLFFQDLKSIQGFLGGYVFRPQAGILSKDMPAVYKEDKLADLADILIKTHKAGSLHFAGMIDVSICFQEALVIVREAPGNTYIFLLVEPTANLNLFNMTLSVLMEDIAALGKNPAPSVTVNTFEPPTAPQAADSTLLPTSLQLLSEGPLSGVLGELHNALAMVTGPIAKVILVDAMDDWRKKHAPVRETLPALVDILYKEIGDPEKANAFRQRIAAVVPKGND